MRTVTKKSIDIAKINFKDTELEQDDRLGMLVDSLTDFEDYVKTGKSDFYCNKIPILSIDGNGRLLLVRNGIVYYNEVIDAYDVSNVKECYLDSLDCVGVLVPFNKKGQKHFCIVNGDEDFNGDADILVTNLIGSNVERATLSFACLSEFFEININTKEKIAEAFAKGKLKIVAYAKDDTKILTKAEAKKIKDWCAKKSVSGKKPPFPVKPPQAGYTYIKGFDDAADRWHRSATVLIYDTKRKITILMGQDEGSYFGCELVDNPKTIAAAYLSLMPKEVRAINGVGVCRQGEWFALPVEESEVPDLLDCAAEADGTVSLPRDNLDSAYHTIERGEVRIGRDGYVYACDAELVHSEGGHGDLCTSGWVKYCRNTARRSFSQEGVD